jgi:hypothetical protein
MSHGGKGDSPRPFSVSQDEFNGRHEAIFGKKPTKVPYVYVPVTEVIELCDNMPKDSTQGG